MPLPDRLWNRKLQRELGTVLLLHSQMNRCARSLPKQVVGQWCSVFSSGTVLLLFPLRGNPEWIPFCCVPCSCERRDRLRCVAFAVGKCRLSTQDESNRSGMAFVGGPIFTRWFLQGVRILDAGMFLGIGGWCVLFYLFFQKYNMMP